MPDLTGFAGRVAVEPSSPHPGPDPHPGIGPHPGADPLTRSLTVQAAVMAERLAGVLEDLGSATPTASAAVDFVRGWAATARQAAPPVPTHPGARTPLESLLSTLGLGDTERQLILLAGLAEEHEGLAATLRSLHPAGEPRPTLGLAALMVAGSGVDRWQLRRLVGDGPAARFGVLRLDGTGGLFERSLGLADRLWEALHGVDGVPPGLAAVPLGAPPVGLDGWLAQDLVHRAVRAVRDRRPVTVLITAADELIAAGRCAALLATAGAREGFAVRVAPGQPIADAARRALVHAAARDAVPVLLLRRDPTPREPGAARPGDDLADLPAPLVLCAETGALATDGQGRVLALAADPVGDEHRRLAWRAGLGVDEEAARTLASRLPLDPAWVATVARDLDAADQQPDVPAAMAAVRRRTAAGLPSGVDLIRPQVPWERLVLPADAAFQLRDAVARLTHQGTVLEDWRMARTARAHPGARILLTGVPGTGKSLAAEALATAAGTDLLRVDLSRMVSKWLGETEKNLAVVFDAAQRSQAVLLLDEADALFGTRTEVSDAQDRYANLETAYLLQRLETFDGLLVLTTNLRHNVDAAFLRRMDVVVDVPLPDEAGRRELWHLHLPAGHVAGDVDLDVLARMYPVPGGWIRNAALTAAFAAAAAGDGVHQHQLVAAVRREYGKAALPFPGEPPRRRDEH